MCDFVRGLRAGIPVALGYFSVSFVFGIMCVSYGFTWWEASLISAMTLTSSGQFSGIMTMMLPGQYLQMLLSQLTINCRYAFMGVSLSQRLDDRLKGGWRWLFAFVITDEIFGVAITEEKVTRPFMAGLGLLPWIGWTSGTVCGALLGNVMPTGVMSALGLALYGMFIAVVVPEMKADHPVCLVVAAAAGLSCAFYFLPFLQQVPSSMAITICAIIAAAFGAVLFPVEEETDTGDAQEAAAYAAVGGGAAQPAYNTGGIF